MVSKDTGSLKVTSIGQGNSLVSPTIKGKQLLATLCSVLKYIEYVVVGVTDVAERDLVAMMIKSHFPPSSPHMSPTTNILERVVIKIFQVPLPALLPFYLLNWGQWLLSQHNCVHHSEYQRKQHNKQRPALTSDDNYCTSGFWSQQDRWSYPRSISGQRISLLTPVSLVYYSESDTVLVPKSSFVMRGFIDVSCVYVYMCICTFFLLITVCSGAGCCDCCGAHAYGKGCNRF